MQIFTLFLGLFNVLTNSFSDSPQHGSFISAKAFQISCFPSLSAASSASCQLSRPAFWQIIRQSQRPHRNPFQINYFLSNSFHHSLHLMKTAFVDCQKDFRTPGCCPSAICLMFLQHLNWLSLLLIHLRHFYVRNLITGNSLLCFFPTLENLQLPRQGRLLISNIHTYPDLLYILRHHFAFRHSEIRFIHMFLRGKQSGGPAGRHL